MAIINTRGLLTDIAKNDLLFCQDISDLTNGASKKTEPRYLELWMKREVGQVKINTGNGVQPSFALTANKPQIFSYASPLGSGQGYTLEVTSELGMPVTLKDSTRFSDAHNAYAVAI